MGGETGAHSRFAPAFDSLFALYVHAVDIVADTLLDVATMQLRVAYVHAEMSTLSREPTPQSVGHQYPDGSGGYPAEVDPWNVSVASLRDMLV